MSPKKSVLDDNPAPNNSQLGRRRTAGRIWRDRGDRGYYERRSETQTGGCRTVGGIYYVGAAPCRLTGGRCPQGRRIDGRGRSPRLGRAWCYSLAAIPE